MTLDAFKESPWRTSHRAYSEADLAMRPAPEYANSEVLLASLYRVVGLGVQESEVTKQGRELLGRVSSPKAPPAHATASATTWSTVIRGSLESPKLPNQSSKRFLQLTPIVPEVARYSGSARLAGNPWTPGSLVQRMILLGSTSPDQARETWERLFAALAISEQDDIWARWLESEFSAWRNSGVSWTKRELNGLPCEFPLTDGSAIQYPAKRFVQDLLAVIDLKERVTRRQWTSLLESTIRIAAVAHVLWLCDVNHRIWKVARAALDDKGNACVPEDQIRGLIYPGSLEYFPYGAGALFRANDLISRYLNARLGINALLWGLNQVSNAAIAPLSSAQSVAAFIDAVSRHRSDLSSLDVQGIYGGFQQTEARTLSGVKGVGSNLREFVRHSIGQRQTANEALRGYDQGYSAKKKSSDANSRWIVGLGPVAILAVTHCCLHGTSGARSVTRLCEHLAEYGIRIGKDEIGTSELGQNLRMLGLVLDSPDAESGMLVIAPFGANRSVG